MAHRYHFSIAKSPRQICEIVLGKERILYAIQTSNRARYLRMTVGLKDGLVVMVPRYGNERMVELFLRQKASWILKQLRRVEKLKSKTVLKHSKEEYEKNKYEFLKLVTQRIEFFNSLYRFSYKKISIRNQTSLWGSCTRGGNLQFNYKLSSLSKESIDYVVVHELCHLKEHNHGLRFWSLVAKTIPNYKEIRKTLRQYIMSDEIQ